MKPKITEEQEAEAYETLMSEQLLFTQLGMTISDYINARMTGRSIYESLMERISKEDIIEH
jgi:hypothetical protein